MLELAPSDPIVETYLKDLQHLKDQLVVHELGLKGPFQNLRDKAAKRRGWTLVPELSTYSGGKRVVPDGTVRDEYRLARGWWEAKDTSDHLAAEIQKKLKAGYPARNTIFEDTQVAVLYQDRGEAGEFALTEPVKIADLLNRFFSHDESQEREFERAMQEFKSRIPDLAQSLGDRVPSGFAVGARMGHRSVSGERRVRPKPRRRPGLYRAPGRPSSARQHRDSSDRKALPNYR